jgi:hypothetical protein
MSYATIRRENEKAVLSLEARQAAERTAEAHLTAGTAGPKEWAWRLRERELSGEVLSRRSRELWRAALAGELAAAGLA